MPIPRQIVLIEAKKNQDWRLQGSGVLLHCKRQGGSGHDVIITCRHVVADNDILADDVAIWPQEVAFGPAQARKATINPAWLDGVLEDARDLVILELKEQLGFDGLQQFVSPAQDGSVGVYGYPLGDERIATLGEGVVRPRVFDGKITAITQDSIYGCSADAAEGVSGGAVLTEKGELVGIWRGKWAPDLKYGEGTVIGSHWIKRLCERAGYQCNAIEQVSEVKAVFPSSQGKGQLGKRHYRILRALFNDPGRKLFYYQKDDSQAAFEDLQRIGYIDDVDGRFKLTKSGTQATVGYLLEVINSLSSIPHQPDRCEENFHAKHWRILRSLFHDTITDIYAYQDSYYRHAFNDLLNNGYVYKTDNGYELTDKGTHYTVHYLSDVIQKVTNHQRLPEKKEMAKLTLSQMAELAQECVSNLPKERAEFALMQINLEPRIVPNANTPDLVDYYTRLIKYLNSKEDENFMENMLQQWLEKLALDHLIFAQKWLQRIKGN